MTLQFLEKAVLFAGLLLTTGGVVSTARVQSVGQIKALPRPTIKGQLSLEEALATRRSIRTFTDQVLNARQIAQLCWSAQGITDHQRSFRTAPSAGALYPIELYVVTADGVDHYLPAGHQLQRHVEGDRRRALQTAALNQAWVGKSPACFVIVTVQRRSAVKYGDRAEQYCLQESGHIAQNLLLQATSLGLAGVPVGGFKPMEVAEELSLPEGQEAVYLLPIGHPVKDSGKGKP
jgi:SagB-type dehydrogenase family enzyme